MTRIAQLTAATELTGADEVPLEQGGDTLRASMALILSYVQDNLIFETTTLTPQYSAPLTGTTVTVAAADSWLILTPAGTLAALTIALPAGAAGARVCINSTQIITALSFSGGTVSGGPTTLAADGFCELRYDAIYSIWRRVA